MSFPVLCGVKSYSRGPRPPLVWKWGSSPIGRGSVCDRRNESERHHQIIRLAHTCWPVVNEAPCCAIEAPCCVITFNLPIVAPHASAKG